MKFPTLQVAADGRVRVELPRDGTGSFAKHALFNVLPPHTWARDGRQYVVDADCLEALVASLEHYYTNIRLLEPEDAEAGTVDDPPPSPDGEVDDPWDGLSDLPPELAKKAYKALARVLHPDADGDSDAFVRLQDWKRRQGIE